MFICNMYSWSPLWGNFTYVRMYACTHVYMLYVKYFESLVMKWLLSEAPAIDTLITLVCVMVIDSHTCTRWLSPPYVHTYIHTFAIPPPPKKMYSTLLVYTCAVMVFLSLSLSLTHTHTHMHTRTLQFLLTFHPGFAVSLFALSPSSTFSTSGQLLLLVSTPRPPHYERVHPQLPPAGELPQP